MGSQNNFQFGPFTLFMIVIVLCGYVLTGLYITEGIETSMMLMLAWGVYTLMALTFLNVLLVGLFWSVVRKKTGMSGVRGISGNRGEQGPRGQCDVNSIQNYTIMTLTNTIDKLYKQQPGNSNVSIIDPTSHRLINNYLNTKISDMASSHQINMLVNVSMVNSVPLAQLVSYLANIWTTWFNLIYAVGGSAWFNNVYGDENGPWVNAAGSQPTATPTVTPTGTRASQPTVTGSYPTAHPTETAPLNPFIEIRKYDVYNWGLTRSFRPLKIEVCQSTINHENPDLPIKKQPQLKVIASNDYKLVSNDKNVAGGSPNISWWRANKATINNDVYYPVGDVPMAGPSDIVYNAAFKTGKTILGTMEYDVKKGSSGPGTVNGPDIQTILISGDVKAPISYQNTSNYAGEFNPGLWRPVCPQGYISLGDIASIGSNIAANNPPVCVPEKCVEPIGQDGNTIWTNGTGIIKNINGWFWTAPDDNTPQPNYSYNLMRSDTNTSTSNGSNVFYKLRPDCLNVGNNAPSTKKLEKSTAQLGIGWYGSPSKLEPKYSIFSFLGMVPEGLILHQGTGRRFYIIHYGGDDLNKFIILDYNGGTGNFDGALQVDSDTNSVIISLQDIVYTDARQQWIVNLSTQYSRTANGKKIFVLNSVYNSRTLYLGLEPTLGEAIFSTINLANPGPPYTSLSAQVLTSSVTFSFIPAVGVHTDVLDIVA
uniref:Uncharacterized protein n=1 Tax=viral metagenome TaxID=1070528 RepID=A0A6C0HLT7_9ZZZZ